MKLFLHFFSDEKTYTVEVDARDKIKTLKIKLLDKTGEQPFTLKLFYSGKELNDEDTFEQKGILTESTINVTRLQTQGEHLELTVQSLITDSLKTFIRIEEGRNVSYLKKKIFEVFRCSPEKQLLFAINVKDNPEKRIYLDDAKGLWEYELDHRFVIYAYYEFEGTLTFSHKLTGHRYTMKIRSNNLISQIKDQLRNEYHISVTEVYNDSNVKLGNQTSLGENMITPKDMLLIELLDDFPRKPSNTQAQPEYQRHYSELQKAQSLPKPQQKTRDQKFPHPGDQNFYQQGVQNYQHPGGQNYQTGRDPNAHHQRGAVVHQHSDPNIQPQFRPQLDPNFPQQMDPNFPQQGFNEYQRQPVPDRLRGRQPSIKFPKQKEFDDRSQSEFGGRRAQPQDFNEGYNRPHDGPNLRKPNPFGGSSNLRTPFQLPKQEDWYGDQPGSGIYQTREAVFAKPQAHPPQGEEMRDGFLAQVIIAAEREWEQIGTILLDDFPRILQLKRENNNETYTSSMCVLHEWKQRWQANGERSGAMPYNSESLIYALNGVGRQDLVHKFFPRK